jgi:hypothetical protein
MGKRVATAQKHAFVEAENHIPDNNEQAQALSL